LAPRGGAVSGVPGKVSETRQRVHARKEGSRCMARRVRCWWA